MSYLKEAESACPHCQQPNEVEVWSSINVQEDPELQDLLLGGEINMTECEGCREIFYAEHFLLYHDSKRELLAFVYPRDAASEREKWVEKTRTDFAQTESETDSEKKIKYAPITLFGLDELVRLIEHEDEVEIQSDIVATLAREGGIEIQRIAPALARQRQVPTVLPFAPEAAGGEREKLIKGLEKLAKINDRLSIYTQLKESLLSSTRPAH